MVYTIKISRIFERDFSGLDSITQSRVMVALEKIRINPFLNVKKLSQVNVGVFRLRIGDYRLRFDIFKHDIYLYCIRHRKDVYRK